VGKPGKPALLYAFFFLHSTKNLVQGLETYRRTV